MDRMFNVEIMSEDDYAVTLALPATDYELLDASGEDAPLQELRAEEAELLAAESRLRSAVLNSPEDTPLVKVGGRALALKGPSAR